MLSSFVFMYRIGISPAEVTGTTRSLNYLLLYCMGTAVTDVVRTCGPTPLHMFIVKNIISFYKKLK